MRLDGYLSWLVAQAQPAGPPPSISPEVIKALAELITASGSVPAPESWFTAERVQSFASMAAAVAWPLSAIVIALTFRRPIIDFLSNVTDVEIAGAKFKRVLQKELATAEREASSKPSPPTANEQARAAAVASMLEGASSLVAREAEALAFEYERERASRPSGDERTRRMEVVVAKMRTIGQAAFPLRYELAASPSPGKRLMAIAALQVVPDYEMLDWLAERPAKEKPFVGYHALIALLQAARGPNAAAHRKALADALAIAEKGSASFGQDTDRQKLLAEFKAAVERVKATEPIEDPA